MSNRKRRKADLVGNECHPYGAPPMERGEVVAFKDRATDEVAWRARPNRVERRKSGTKSMQAAPERATKSAPLKPNRAAIREGYNPYNSGEIVKIKNPGVRRNLRELGQWLKSQPVKSRKKEPISQP